jgi:hypothetical protein
MRVSFAILSILVVLCGVWTWPTGRADVKTSRGYAGVAEGDAVAGRSQCRQCTAAVPSGANFCVECGASVAPLVVDLLGVDESPLPSGTDVTPHPQRGLWAVLALFAAMVLVLWGVARGVDRPNDEPLGAEVPEEGIAAVDPTTPTTVVTTTTATTTGAQPTTSEQLFVNDVSGAVLGEDVDGVLVQFAGSIMRHVDLSTGAVDIIDLEQHVYQWAGPEASIVDGKLVSFSGSGRVMIITDLSDGSQRESRDITDDSIEIHLVGRAGSESVWLATDPEPDQISEAIEVGLDGEIRRRVEIPRPFEIRWAEGHDLILDSPDGTWRYDTETGATVRMPGQVLAFEPGFVLTSSCDESLQCGVLLDRGSGPEVVDWVSASDDFDGPIDLSPDLSGALLHVYGEQDGAEFSYIDLRTGSIVDLGNLRISPDRGVVWIEGSPWIIGQNETSNIKLAIDTQTGTQVDLALSRRRNSESFLAFIPPN